MPDIVSLCSLKHNRRRWPLRRLKKAAPHTLCHSEPWDGESQLGWWWRLRLHHIAGDFGFVPVVQELLPVLQGAADSVASACAELVGYVGSRQLRYVQLLLGWWSTGSWRLLHKSDFASDTTWSWAGTRAEQSRRRTSAEHSKLRWLATSSSNSPAWSHSSNSPAFAVWHHPSNNSTTTKSHNAADNNLGNETSIWPVWSAGLCSNWYNHKTTFARHPHRIADHQRRDVWWRQLWCKKWICCKLPSKVGICAESNFTSFTAFRIKNELWVVRMLIQMNGLGLLCFSIADDSSAVALWSMTFTWVQLELSTSTHRNWHSICRSSQQLIVSLTWAHGTSPDLPSVSASITSESTQKSSTSSAKSNESSVIVVLTRERSTTTSQFWHSTRRFHSQRPSNRFASRHQDRDSLTD